MRRFVYYGASSAGGALLLDLYPATAAYSLRKLRTDYTGACIRVRRSSDNTEQDIGFVGNDLDTASLLSFVGAGNGFVTTWYDQQGSNNLTQAISSGQPQIVASGSIILRSSLAAVSFNGVTNQLFFNSQVLNTTNISMFSVSNNDINNNVGTVFASSFNNNNTMRVFNDRRTIKRNMFITEAGLFSSNMSIIRNTSDIRLLSSFIDGSKFMSSFDNGQTGTTDTYVGTYINNGLRMGVQGTGNVTFLNGTIQELILFNTHETSNRTAIETNINDYYAIY